MPTAHEARVPHILQNDVNDLQPIRCGPACTQAILYGLDDRVFDASGGPSLIATLPVQADQDAIWTEIKQLSSALATQLGGSAAVTEAQQVCTADGQCWATHPSAMATLLRDGVHTTQFALSGNSHVTAQMLPERDVPVAVVDSLSQGVGAAILIKGSHWVVAYKTSPLGAQDVAIHYHDPLIAATTSWLGIERLVAAILDVEPATADATETAVVGAQTAQFNALRSELRSQPLPPPPPPSMARQVDDLWQQDVVALLGQAVDSVATLGVPMGPEKPTRVLPVRHLSNPDRSYIIVEFRPHTMVIVDALTQHPWEAANSLDETRPLPTILDVEQIRQAVTGQLVWIDRREVRLQGPPLLRIEPGLVWASCEQSRSMFIPFYAAEQDRADGGPPDRVLIRASDGKPFAWPSRLR